MSGNSNSKRQPLNEHEARKLLSSAGQNPDEIIHAYCEDGEPMWRVFLRQMTTPASGRARLAVADC